MHHGSDTISPNAPENPAVGPSVNALAIVALVCAVFLPLAGLVMSIVVYVQARRQHQPGRLLAVAAMMLSIWMSLFTAVFAVLIATFPLWFPTLVYSSAP